MHRSAISHAVASTAEATRSAGVIRGVARATIAGLQSLQRPDEVAKRRGIPAEDFVPKGLLNAYNERQKQMAANAAGASDE